MAGGNTPKQVGGKSPDLSFFKIFLVYLMGLLSAM